MLTAILCMISLHCIGHSSPQPIRPIQHGAVIAFVDVNVVPMDKERVLPHQTVLIRDGRIRALGPAGKVHIPKGAFRIDARGKYLMPGLADMHVHLRSRTELPLYIVNGVTTVFNLNGRSSHLLWRQQTASGELLGPTIYSCGPKFDRPRTPQEAVQEVDRQSQAGYDAVKIYNQVSKAEYPALIAEAKRRHLIIIGHIAREPGFEATLQAGQSIAHAEEYLYTFFNHTNNIDKMQFDESRIPQAVAMTRQAGIWVEPTLVTYDHIVQQAADLQAYLARPELKYIAPPLHEQLEPAFNIYAHDFDAEEVPKLRQSLAFQKKLVHALHLAGVPLLPGTDSMGIGPTAGFALHEELRNFIEVGLTPFETLQAATKKAAEFLRKGKEFGTVSVGKRADLLLLDANPLMDVDNTNRLSGVMVRGQWLPATRLHRLLSSLPNAYREEERRVSEDLEHDPDRAIRYLDDNDPFNQLSSDLYSKIALEQGVEKLKSVLQEIKDRQPGALAIQEDSISALGYSLLAKKKPQEAIDVLQWNVAAHPKSADAYDSLADVCMLSGNKTLAIEYYKKALEADPNYFNASFVRGLLKRYNASPALTP